MKKSPASAGFLRCPQLVHSLYTYLSYAIRASRAYILNITFVIEGLGETFYKKLVGTTGIGTRAIGGTRG